MAFQWSESDPDWVRGEPVKTIDGTAMLERGEHPLNRINKLMGEVGAGEFILLKTDFQPLPLIDEMARQKYEVFSKSSDDQPDNYFTFIRRNH